MPARTRRTYRRFLEPPRIPSPALPFYLAAFALFLSLFLVLPQLKLEYLRETWLIGFIVKPDILAFAALLTSLLLTTAMAVAISISFENLNNALREMYRELAELRAALEPLQERVEKTEEDLSRLRVKVLQLERR